MTDKSRTNGRGRRPLKTSVVIGLMLPSLVASSAPAADPAAVQKQLDATAAEYGRLETQLADTEARREKLEVDLRKADRIIADKSVLLRKRAGYMYKHGGATGFLEGLLTAQDMGIFLRRLFYVEIVGGKDSRLVEGLQMTKSRADDIREGLNVALAAQRSVIRDLREKRAQLEVQFKGAKGAAKVKRFGSFESFTLPVSPSGFANTWGARRSRGRRHKGTDVMAPCGAPVFATTDGTVQDLHSGGNGGTMLYLRAANGDVFFYAHLRKYAPGISSGASVRTGQLVAYNGNTGNARGGACHVHFEWHPGGGGAVNPYPLLAAIR